MSLNHYINKKVLIITVDGRTLTGTLVSCDQVTNLVLADTVERIIREQGDDEPSSEQPHGLYLVRGDNVVVCGLVDEELDASIDWSKVGFEDLGGSGNIYDGRHGGQPRRAYDHACFVKLRTIVPYDQASVGYTGGGSSCSKSNKPRHAYHENYISQTRDSTYGDA